MTYQKLIIVGNVGKEPEMRYTPDGKALTSFSLAVNQGSGDKKETAWFRVVVFGSQAENVEKYLGKGSKALAEGRLTFDAATGAPKMFQRKDGTTATSFEMIADSVRFLDSKKDEQDEE
jgi:single-strand DNA-binding protein